MGKKLTKKELSVRLNDLAYKAAVQHGGKVKFGPAENVMTQLEFTCSKGHTFSKSIRAVVSRGGWCDYCRKNLPSSSIEASQILGKSKWSLISETKSGKKMYKVRCQICGIERVGSLRNFKNKPCSHIKRSTATPLSRIEQKVLSLEGKVLSLKVSNLDSQIKFECKEKHHFSLRGRDVLTRGTWCKECNTKGVTPKRIAKLVNERGGSIISTIPSRITTESKILIKCSMGHEFMNDWAHMSPPRNGWCSICSKGNKSEEIARATFKQLFGGDFRKARPAWLKNSRGYQMELDGYEASLSLAFEYQGRQHFENVGLFSTEDKLKQRISDDKEKEKLCKENGVTLVHLSWETNYEDFPDVIRKKLSKSRPDLIAGIKFTSAINLNAAFIKDDRLEELRAALATRNLELISTKWISVSFRYEILCKVCGYKFSQPARAYLNSRKVAGCKKCAMKRTADDVRKRKLGYGALTEVAQKYGGKCASTEYKTVKTKYQWICSKGHQFTRTLDSIQSKGTFCTPCSVGIPTTSDLKSYAESHGGTLVTPEYVGSTFKYQWKCAVGHKFARTWANVRISKYFCPICKS